MFQLEAIFAKHGDCLLLHYGPDAAAHPRWLLIDGGASGVYGDFLKPRLVQLAEDFELAGPVPLEMVMVSHVDADHIAGILDLFKHLKSTNQQPKICTVGQLWHNSFDDIIGNDDEELVSKLIADPPGGVERDEEREGAVVASVNQGRNLRNDARSLAMVTNRPFTGLVRAQEGPAEAIAMGEGLTFKVLAPSESRLKAYQEKWNEFLESKGLAEVEAAGFNDPSAYNLASIVVLAEMEGKSMLLTGDARGDYIVNGLVDAGLLDEAARYPLREEFPDGRAGSREWRRASDEADARDDFEPLHVDLLKAPHHGSANNVTPGFFRRVTADHYVFSGNGNHHNPDPEALDMLAGARGDDEYTIHFTFTADQHETEPNDKFARNLATVHEWVENSKPDGCTVIHREAGEEVYSIFVEP